MPDVVAHGKEQAQPQVFACSLCHLPNGFGRPENANITGLSVIDVDISSKQLELLKTFVPHLTRVVVLLNPGNPANPAVFKHVQAGASALGVGADLVDTKAIREGRSAEITARARQFVEIVRAARAS